MENSDKKVRKAAIVVHSGTVDKVMSALIIGNGALAMGLECTLFFTFWGLSALKKGKSDSMPLSRMNFFGLGRKMMSRIMRKHNVAMPHRLLKDYKELGGKIIACEMTMSLMNIKENQLDESLIDSYGTVGSFVYEAKDAQITLFI